MLALAALLAAPGAASDGTAGTATAIRLFRTGCLETLPDFAGAAAVFDGAGFVRLEATHNRVHPAGYSALVLTPDADMPTGSFPACAVISEHDPDGLAEAVAPLVVAYLPSATAHAAASGRQVTWTAALGAATAQVTALERAGEGYLGVMMTPGPVSR